MKQYNVRYDKTIQLVLALVFPPLLVVPLILLLAIYLPGLPDWGVGTIIGATLVVIVTFTLSLVKRLSPKGLLILYDDKFVVEFPPKSFFTPASFEIRIDDIIKCFAGVSKAGFYLRFVTSTGPGKFNLQAGSSEEEDHKDFLELMKSISEKMGGRYTSVWP